VKRAVNHAHNEALWAWKQKEKAQSAIRRVMKERGGYTPTESDSSEEE
jgi:hypothetical protein